MSLMDDILTKAGVKYEELTSEEKETLNTWMNVIQESQLTLEKVKLYIASMRDSVEQELTKPRLTKEKDLFLKARLRNYMLLESLLSTPERAKAALNRAITGIKAGKK